MNIAKPDMKLTGNVSAEFDKADAKLRKARKKKKARKKIKSHHINSVKQGRTKSVSGTRKGTGAHKKAFDTYQGNKGTIKQAQGRFEFKNNLRGHMANAVSGGGYSAPSLSVSPVSSLNGIKDVDQLAGMLSNQQGRQSQLSQALTRIGKDQKNQLGVNRTLTGHFKKFSKAEKAFGMKEKFYNVKKGMFNGLSKTLSGVGTALTTAATAITSAATAVQSAASACAAIPYVGPALSAALKAVAMMLKGIAKGLKDGR